MISNNLSVSTLNLPLLMRSLMSISFALVVGIICAQQPDKSGGLDSQEPLQVFIPNAFTPNADGYNDYWRPVISGPAIEAYEVSVLDRYGNEVFRSQNPQDVWGGGAQGSSYVASSSLYVYFLKLKVAGDIETRVYKGHITLVR